MISGTAGTPGTGSPAAKKGRKERKKRGKDKYDVPVGHHRDYEGIPVYARVPNNARYEDRVKLRTFGEDIDPSVPQVVKELYSAKPQFRFDQTFLSKESFPEFQGDIRAIDEAMKRKLILSLVLTPKTLADDTEDDSMELDDRTPVFAGLYGSRSASTVKVEPYTFPYVEIQVREIVPTNLVPFKGVVDYADVSGRLPQGGYRLPSLRISDKVCSPRTQVCYIVPPELGNVR